jgi:hypothetical protein
MFEIENSFSERPFSLSEKEISLSERPFSLFKTENGCSETAVTGNFPPLRFG